jgi:hypothetical protein
LLSAQQVCTGLMTALIVVTVLTMGVTVVVTTALRVVTMVVPVVAPRVVTVVLAAPTLLTCGNLWFRISARLLSPCCRVFLLKEIKRVENKKGKVSLYATNKYMQQRASFDCVVLLMTDDDDNNFFQCAQLLVLLQIDDQDDTTHHAIVRFLQTAKPTKASGRGRRAVSQQPPPEYQSPFKIYEWERKANGQFYTALVNIKSIVSSAFMVPVCSNNMPTCGHPSRNDKYWHMEHQYSDRAGWDDITVAAGIIAADQDANEIDIEVNFEGNEDGDGDVNGEDVDSNSDGEMGNDVYQEDTDN